MAVSARKSSEASSDTEIVTSRVLDASREGVFAAWADPARLARWWGPAGFTNTFEEFHFTPGGAWRFVMHGPDGVDYKNESVFEEVVPPERIVVRHLSGHRFLLTATLEKHGAGTLLTWRMQFETAKERARVARYAVAANEENLDRLAAELLHPSS